MSLLGAYKKKTSYDGYESLQLVDSGGDGFSIGRGSSGGGSSGTLAASSVGAKAAAGPLREEDCSTMDSSGRTAALSTLWVPVGYPRPPGSDGDDWSVCTGW